MQDYPEHKFVCSQAQQLAWMKKQQPVNWTRSGATLSLRPFQILTLKLRMS